MPRLDWFKLPQEFQGSCYLAADTSSIQKYLTPNQTANPNEAEDTNLQCDHENQQQEQVLPQIPTRKVCITINIIDMYSKALYA